MSGRASFDAGGNYVDGQVIDDSALFINFWSGSDELRFSSVTVQNYGMGVKLLR